MFRWLGAMIDRTFGLTGAFIFSQAPLFIHQYTQQLSGRIAELQHQVNTMQQAAGQTDKTLAQFIQKFINSPDPDFSSQGLIMEGMVDRYTAMSEAYRHLQTTQLLAKPFIFLRHLDWEIAGSTLKSYQLGIPFSVEGAAYAIAGMAVGFALYRALRKFWLSLSGMFTKKKLHSDRG